MTKMNDIIKLSVGGREFKTSRGTLMADQYSMLSKMTLQYREYGYPRNSQLLEKGFEDRGQRQRRRYSTPRNSQLLEQLS